MVKHAVLILILECLSLSQSYFPLVLSCDWVLLLLFCFVLPVLCCFRTLIYLKFSFAYDVQESNLFLDGSQCIVSFIK